MRRAWILLAGALLLPGCSADGGIAGGGEVIGDTLTVYSSLPHPREGAQRDIVDGEKLALAQRGGRAGAFGVNFASLDELDDPAEVAREIMRDQQVIAAIGAERSDTARTMVPLIDAAGLLLVSPGAVDPALARDPRYSPSGRRSFADLMGDEAPALLAAAGGERVAIEAEPESATLAARLRRQVGGRLVADAARADAVIYAGEDPAAAARVANGLPAGTRIVLPDAVVRAGVERRLDASARARAVFVSSAPEPGSTPALRRFEAEFRARFGHAPGPYAAVGHAAMLAVLDAIARAGPEANEREAVIRAFFAARRPAPGFTAYRLRGGRREYVGG